MAHHEIGLAHDILRKAMAAAQAKGLKKIKRIKASVGEFLLPNTDNIKHSFFMITKGTPAEGAKLEVVVAKLKAKCASCGGEFDIKGLKCLSCNGTGMNITDGKELLVELVE